MGWEFEYLEDQLYQAVMKQLRRYGVSEIDYIEFDDETMDTVHYGEGYPAEGEYEGVATVYLKDGSEQEYLVRYSIEAFLSREGFRPFVDYRIRKVKIKRIKQEECPCFTC